VPFDLKATLRDVSKMWEEQARAKGVAFTLDLADAPDHVEGDAARLRQIIFNLLSNALKFTESGSVGVRAATIDGPAGRLLSIAVSDSGIGIPPDKYDLIFESFRQVDAGTTRKFGGTGLGLSICRNLAQAMGGDVSVRSTPGQGSTFILDLPLLLAAAPEAAMTAVGGTPSALLILDRNPITRSMLRAVLEERAGSVVFASSVEEAVERIGTGGVAQLLIDDATIKANDDVMSALGTLSAAASRVGTRTTLLWLRPDDAQRAEFMRAGIHAVVGKPIQGAALAAALFPLYKSAIKEPNQLVTRAA
jgi:CheY-like chemotaxis protein